MDELFAAIAAYLRRNNRRLSPGTLGQVARAWETSARVHGGQQVYCRWCGRPITSGEGLFELEKLWADRSCADHYIPF